VLAKWLRLASALEEEAMKVKEDADAWAFLAKASRREEATREAAFREEECLAAFRHRLIHKNVDQRGNDPSLDYTLLGRMRLFQRMDARMITRFKVGPSLQNYSEMRIRTRMSWLRTRLPYH
jgi:hypothetical protein